MNLFDQVDLPARSSDSPKQLAESASSPQRMCTYRTRFGAPCTQVAEPNSLVCAAHGNNKVSLTNLRRQAAQLGPLFLDRLEEIAITGDNYEVVAASKVWSEIAGVKDIPPMGSGLEEEELEQARTNLGRKLEAMIGHIAKRKIG